MGIENSICKRSRKRNEDATYSRKASANFDIWRMKIQLINGPAEKLVV